MGINTNICSGANNYTPKSNSSVANTTKVQVSGWEVAAGISDSVEEIEIEGTFDSKNTVSPISSYATNNTNNINISATQELYDYVQQTCVNQTDAITFSEVTKIKKYKELVEKAGYNVDDFKSYADFLTIIEGNLELYEIEENIDKATKELEQLKNDKEKFYNEISELLGDDFKYTLNQYNNDIETRLISSQGNFIDQMQRFLNGYTITDKQELEIYTNIIYECLLENENGKKDYTKEEITEILSGQSGNIEELYSAFNQGVTDNLTEALKKYYPEVTSEIAVLEEKYNSLLESEGLSLSDCQTMLEMYDYYISSYEQQIEVNEQNKINLYYSNIMNTSDYISFEMDTSYEEELKNYIKDQINNFNQASYEKYKEDYPDSNLSPLLFYKSVYDNYLDFTISINGIEYEEKIKMNNFLDALEYNPELLKMYNYLYYTQGIEAADQYIKDTETNVNQTLAQVNVQAMLNNVELDKEYSVTIDGKKITYSVVVNDGKLVIKGIEDGVENFFNGLIGWFNTNESKTIEEWEQYYFMLSIMSEKDKKEYGLIDQNGNSTSPYIDFSKNYYNFGGKQVYNVSSSIGNMLPSMLLSTINPVLGTASMGVSAGGNSFRSAITDGYDLSKAIAYGIVSGASEAALEKFLGSIPGLGSGKHEISGLKNWLLSCWDEGLEEFTQEGVDLVIRNVLFGEEVEFEDALKQMGVAGLYGAVTGGIMNGFTMTFTSAAIDPKIKEVLKANNGELTYTQIAEMFNVDEKYIKKIEQKIEKKSSTQNDTATSNLDAPNVDAEVKTSVNDSASNVEYNFNPIGTYEQYGIQSVLETFSTYYDLIMNKGSNANRVIDGVEYSPNEFLKLIAEEAYKDPIVQSYIDGKSNNIYLDQIQTIDKIKEILNTEVEDTQSITSNSNVETNTIENNLSQITDIKEIENCLNNGTITKEEVSNLFCNIIGSNLSNWISNSDSGYSLYINLLGACNSANISIDQIKDSIGVLNLMSKYYEDAKSLQLDKGGEIFDTYRTHGIVHIFDVLTQSINTYVAFEKVGIKNISLKTVMLSAMMHDTGMSGGKQIKLTTDSNGKLMIDTIDIESNGKNYRESHSFNSGINTINEYSVLRESGYSDIEIAEAALLAFAHSKSNSGLKTLSNNSYGWSFAIQSLSEATKESDFNFVKVLIDNGIIKSPNTNTSSEKITVKCPDGKITGNIETYDLDINWMKKMAYEALAVRIGDALTNNDNAGTNQYGKQITFTSTDYDKQNSISDILEYFQIDPTLNVEEQFEALMETDFEKIARYEAQNVTYEVDGKIQTKSQEYVLGEKNQTYRVEPNANGDVEVIVSIRDSEAIPFCTLYAVNERAGELDSKGNDVDAIFNKYDSNSSHLELVIEIDSNTSENVKNLYKQYAEYKTETGAVKVKIKEI